MPIIRKQFIRRSGLRDAKLLVIASEGQKTEPKYFTDLKDVYTRSGLHVEVLERSESASSPLHVLAHLNKFKTKYKLRRDDELWMVIDVDRWPEHNLRDVAGKCRDKGFCLAVSNPCFVFRWLLNFGCRSRFSMAKFVRNKSIFACRKNNTPLKRKY